MPVTTILRRLAVVVALLAAIAGCSGSDQPSLSGGEVRQDAPGDAAGDPDLEADKETACDAGESTGDAAFETAFCAYQDAALAAVSGPDGVAGVSDELLTAGDRALELVESDPAAATQILLDATAALG